MKSVLVLIPDTLTDPVVVVVVVVLVLPVLVTRVEEPKLRDPKF